jgi:hypothetical protein
MMKANGTTSQGRTKIDKVTALMMHNVTVKEEEEE